MTNKKLEIIHTLVNSTLTASIESDLEATKQGLTTMRELAAERKLAGRDIAPETVAAMAAAEAKIDFLTQKMADRLHSAEAVLAQERNASLAT